MKAVKTLFIWLLITLVPLQGMAANALLVCRAAGQLTVAASGEHAHPCGGMQASQDDKQQNDKTTCAAQYAGVPWMPPAEQHLPASPILSAIVSYAGFHILSVIPDGLERPPRTQFL